MQPNGRAYIENSLLESLFPFHLKFEPTPEGLLFQVGPAISKLFDQDLSGQQFGSIFKAFRPKSEYIDRTFIERNAGRVVFLSVEEKSLHLRGQIEFIEAGNAVFCGSLLATTASSIYKHGLKMGDFAPHDTTPDIVIHHRFREMQVEDIQRKTSALLQALEERDEYSEMASIDPLTGVYNRRAFWRYSQEPLQTQCGKRALAVLVADLDGFKAINDEYGHSAGDYVLKIVANRLRKSLAEKDIVGRLGGDEFAVLVNAPNFTALQDRVAAIYDELCKPIRQDGILYNISASVGVIEASPDRCLDDLLSDADIAMYAGREIRSTQATWFSRKMREASEEYKYLSQDLSDALLNGKLDQAYQPIVELKNGSVTAFEALARWHHPVRGNLPPDKFIDVAQRAGLIPELDRSMLEASLEMLRQCHCNNYLVAMQVNFSGQSITEDLPKFVADQLNKYGIAPHYLTLELTETWIVNNLLETADVMQALADIGVNLHLDDFGTGYSSLSHLQTFPINGLKIDRSFVNQLKDDVRSRQLIDATMAIAKSLNLEVVAEGIETQEQAQYVTKLGCTFGQGYYYSKPVSYEQAINMLESHDRAA